MSFETWALFVGASTLCTFSPGPTVLLAISHGARFGFRNARKTILGNISANSIHIFLVAIGLSKLIVESVFLFSLLKMFGAVYLLHLGIQHWKNAANANQKAEDYLVKRQRLFQQGFMVSISNPKAIVFYLTFLPLFVDPKTNVYLQFLVLGVTFVMANCVALVTYSCLASRTSERLVSDRKVTWLRRGAGTAFIISAFSLAFARRN